MSRVVFELMRWPEGLGLNICSKDRKAGYGLGGACGGGVGHTLEYFIVDVAKLEEYVKKWKYN